MTRFYAKNVTIEVFKKTLNEVLDNYILQWNVQSENIVLIFNKIHIL